MTTAALTALLERHTPADEKERADLAAQRAFAVTLAEPFSRGQQPAHFTGSALVVDPPGERVCLVLHRKLKRWLQPGGHAEPGDAGDLARTALREAAEETGLVVRLHPAAPLPLDVDVHGIPGRADEPAHQHLDVRFLLVADDPRALAHDPLEAHGARWLTWAEALEQADEPAMRRLLEKGRAVARRATG